MASSEVKIRFRTRENPERDPIDEVVKMISRAKKTVDAVVYKVNRPRVFKAFKQAADRGVKVRVVINHDLLLKKYPRKKLRTLAKTKNVKVKTWTKGKLHMKLLVVDKKRVATGTYNLTEMAASKNAELLLRFTGSEYGEEFSNIFDEVWSHKGVKSI